MKVRYDFVTNSSTMNYIVIKVTIPEGAYNSEELTKMLEKLYSDVEYTVELKGIALDDYTKEVEYEYDVYE